jgi:hypothetical protein
VFLSTGTRLAAYHVGGERRGISRSSCFYSLQRHYVAIGCERLSFTAPSECLVPALGCDESTTQIEVHCEGLMSWISSEIIEAQSNCGFLKLLLS